MYFYYGHILWSIFRSACALKHTKYALITDVLHTQYIDTQKIYIKRYLFVIDT